MLASLLYENRGTDEISFFSYRTQMTTPRPPTD